VLPATRTGAGVHKDDGAERLAGSILGLFVRLENGLENQIQISETAGVTSTDITESYEVGDSTAVSIMSLGHEFRKIVLTLRDESQPATDR